MSPTKRQQIHRHESWTKWVLKTSDSIAVGAGLLVLITWLPELNSRSTIAVGIIAIGVYGLIADFVGLYRNWCGIAFEREATCAMIAWGISFVCLAALGRLSIYSSELSGRALVLWFSVAPVLALSVRIFLRGLFRMKTQHGIKTRKFAVVGINELSVEVVRNIEASPELGLQLMGFYDDRPDERVVEIPEDISGKLGRFDDLVENAKRGNVEVVFISLPMRAEKRICAILKQLNDTTASVYIVPDLFVFQMLNSRWTDINGIPVVSVSENPFYGVDGMLKRSFDIVASSFTIVLMAIPMLLVAIAVKMTSAGPVLFRQTRYGLDGKRISVWKYRSMAVSENGAQVVQATQNDPRVTQVGSFLRRTSLDELPQLFNVLMGQMSLVGPRPHATAHNEYYRKQINGYMLRHKVKPGITGLAQVNGCRGETETIEKMENRVQYDHQYIREWTIWLDLKIMLQTLSVVFKQENAY